MRSLCIMLMLCGISTGAWADDETPACQWALTLGIISTPEDYTEDMGTDSSPLEINDDYWDTFVSNVSSISTSDVYFKLNTDVTIDGSSTDWTPISGFEGYFDGNGDNNTVNMPSGNILTLPTLFENESDNSNISNISYSYSDIIITNVEGLQELSENVSSWTEISISYTIDLRDGDIVIDGSSWTPIDDNSSSFTMNYVTDTDNPHFVIFTTSSAADDMDSSPVYLKNSDSEIDTEHWRYSELLIEDDDDFEALDDNSDLLDVALKLTLHYDVDLQDLVGYDINLPFSFSGEFDQNNHSITLPPLTVSSTDVPKLFDDTYKGTPVEYTSAGLLITDASDLDTFANSQETWLAICKDITIGKEGENTDIELSDFIPTISKEFNITDNTSTFTVGSSSTPLDIEGYKPVFEDSDVDADIVDNYYLEISSAKGFEVLTNNSFSTSYDISLNSGAYDLTGITIGTNTSYPVTTDNDATFYLPDDCSGLPFNASGSGYLTKYYSPSCYMVDILYKGALFNSSMRGDNYSSMNDYEFAELLEDAAGHGTSTSPYLIYNYEMLKKLAETVNDKGEDYTSGMHIKLMSDINMQGNKRLTDINGNPSNTTATVQFTTFKGHFNGYDGSTVKDDNEEDIPAPNSCHTISGLTRPLFANLDGATIENLGIVDCNMEDAALAETADKTGDNDSQVSMCYVSGVSNGLIPSTGDITATNCYAYKTSTKETTPYNLTAATTLDASKTHLILVDNCYTLRPIGGKEDGSDDIKTDCTLFIPENNNIYTFEYKGSNFSCDNYINYLEWGDDDYWVENPLKSNANMLHNVLYINSWIQNSGKDFSSSEFKSWNTPKLNYLYSWYIVDRKPLAKFSENDMLGAKLNHIYYSRNNVKTSSPAPDGLNTICLPFAWNPATDLYDADGTPITDAVVYILADKLNSSDEFSDSENYYDYSKENSLLFFDPANTDAENTNRYDGFAGVSNALPTILKIPEGKNGWYIKRSGEAYYCKLFGDAYGVPNLYNRYWEDSSLESFDDFDESYLHKGRSFMELGRLGEEWSNSSDQNNYTYSYYHSIDDMSSNCTDGSYWNPVTEMNRDEKEVYDSYSYSVVTIYKAPESNAIAVDGETYPIKIYVEEEPGSGSYSELKYETNIYDRIVIDGEGKPAILYKKATQEKIVIDYDSETIEVCSSNGNGGYESPTGNTISVDIDESCYPLTSGFYVCGGHEDGVWADRSGVYDFPGRAYHLGTFTGITAGTFAGSPAKEGIPAVPGTYTRVIDEENNITDKYSCYKLNSAGTGFAQVTSSSTVQPFRTFFAISRGAADIDTGTPSEAKAYRFGFCGIYDGSDDNQTTSIDGVPVEGIKLMTPNQSRVYSLDGRYVGQYGQKKLARGMYIMNGKKFVVK